MILKASIDPIRNGLVALLSLLFLATCGSGGGDPANAPAKTVDTLAPPTPAPTRFSEADKQSCREKVDKLVAVAQKGKAEDLAPLLVYQGENKEREWKSVCNYQREGDQLFVDKTMAKLQVIVSGLTDHNFREFMVEEEKEGLWYIWIVDMKYEDESRESRAFAFLKVGKQFALGDLD